MRAKMTARHAHWDGMGIEAGTNGVTFGHDTTGAKNFEGKATMGGEEHNQKQTALAVHTGGPFLSELMEACYGWEEPHGNSCA
jgi:hypothetical protein